MGLSDFAARLLIARPLVVPSRLNRPRNRPRPTESRSTKPSNTCLPGRFATGHRIEPRGTSIRLLENDALIWPLAD